ncbi:MAG: 60S ribosomal export protein NMD3 [Thermoplasmatota archaeon]
MFCVECGLEKGDALVDGVCHECFRKKSQFARLPEYVDLEVCVHCHARRRGEIWLDGGLHERYEPLLEAAIREALVVDRRARSIVSRMELVEEDPRNFSALVHVAGVVSGVAFEQDLSTRARVKNQVCTRCSRIEGNYYEAILQVRAEDRELAADEVQRARRVASRFIEKVVADGDRDAFVLKDEMNKGGLDVYVGQIQAARGMSKVIATELGGRVTEHPKIAGVRDGRELWRVTFLVKLPNYRVGDAVIMDDAPLVVLAVDAKKVKLRDPQSGYARTVERDDLEGASVLAGSDAREALVVAADKKELQVLDPWTYATVTVLRGAATAESGGSVRVARWNGELVLLA